MTGKPHVLLAVPAYTGTVHMGTMRSIMSDYTLMLRAGWAVSMEDEIGSADIYDTRARICTSFLDSKATHLLFIDSDVMWQAGAALRLVNHDVDVVAGLYPQRVEPCPSYAIQHVREDGVVSSNHKGLIEVAGVSAGFMCIKRAVIERMSAHYRDDPVAGEYVRNAGRSIALWDPYRKGENKFGEDYAFCQRWRDMGGRIFIDPDIAMGHMGLKVFHARFLDHLQRREPPADERAA